MTTVGKAGRVSKGRRWRVMKKEGGRLTVITSRGYHALVNRIPTDTVDSARVALKDNNRSLSSVVPHIHTIVCRPQQDTHTQHTTAQVNVYTEQYLIHTDHYYTG